MTLPIACRLTLVGALLSAHACAVFAEEQKTVSEPKSIDQFVLDGQYAGPFKDTIVQRWVDRLTGNICYFYIPTVVPAIPSSGSAPGQPRIYGPNGIGSISCVPKPAK